jgi:hypothetical protein
VDITAGTGAPRIQQRPEAQNSVWRRADHRVAPMMRRSKTVANPRRSRPGDLAGRSGEEASLEFYEKCASVSAKTSGVDIVNGAARVGFPQALSAGIDRDIRAADWLSTERSATRLNTREWPRPLFLCKTPVRLRPRPLAGGPRARAYRSLFSRPHGMPWRSWDRRWASCSECRGRFARLLL